MKRQYRNPAGAVPDAASVDARYGLEPVFEPGAAAGAAGLGEFVAIDCPYCGESFQTLIDLTAGSFSYVEDCQICCQPIELDGRLTEDGALQSLAVRRLD
ncbi:MAG TPA: CPXCG motif-containing cysteine-rich protein [Steroidobacteraceae bacterium]|nr:CPXCG motif-containing cysteine-rich protein [Steroidobacteraceae bacterium]